MCAAFTQEGFYPFEGAASQDLSLIPLAVRYKLDRAEIKLHLKQWQALSVEERRQLLNAPCNTATDVAHYRALLRETIIRQCATEPTPQPTGSDQPWLSTADWPRVVLEQCERQAIALPALERWQALSEMDRHALFVLGRSKHSQPEFAAAMRWFFGQ